MRATSSAVAYSMYRAVRKLFKTMPDRFSGEVGIALPLERITANRPGQEAGRMPVEK
ncbi:hypothetical protein SBA1_360010 [Candidatus Sulfotelmatobacter kueseliae]|uniref:Uncharacterized protein n=1 Tax=Candidatus Sulfotelmatobacter kueseliae TaxID=2042962 RepID=A0A2U3KP17_9BACT|nr:hypothetical protein SBA1_360010 [Candidatus Sulfotelmatobacter kueseliae]